jgi:hypothetical protein
MQPFVLDQHGRLVLPSDVFPELGFSVIRSQDQLVRRDCEMKADQPLRRHHVRQAADPLGRRAAPTRRRVFLPVLTPVLKPRRPSRRSRRPGGVGVPTGRSARRTP